MTTPRTIQATERTPTDRSSSFWFIVTIVGILLFGCVLWLIMWLSVADEPTSNDNNQNPDTSAMLVIGQR